MSSHLQITDSGGRLQPKLLTHRISDPNVVRIKDHVEEFRYFASMLRVGIGVLSREARDRLATLAPLQAELKKTQRKISAIETLLSQGALLLHHGPYQQLQLESLLLQRQINGIKKSLRGIWLEQHELQTVRYPEAYRRHRHAERIAVRVARAKRGGIE